LRRALTWYFGFMSCALVLLAALLVLGQADDAASGWKAETMRLLIGCGAAGAAAATWAAAVAIAYVHRVTWPVLLAVGLVALAGGGFALWCHQHAQLASRFV
jgi:hypothetical protein